MGTRHQKWSERSGQPPAAPRDEHRGSGSTRGRGPVCAHIARFTRGLCTLFNSKGVPSKVRLDHKGVWWKCHLSPSWSTFLVENSLRTCYVGFCMFVQVLRTDQVQQIVLFYLVFWCSASQNDRSFFPHCSICYFYFYYYFSSSKKIALFFFFTSQPMVSRPLATWG